MTSDHFLRGLLLSIAPNVLAVAAALALGLRARLRGRAELAVATVVTWNFLVMCPVYALGLTSHLDARTLAIDSAVWFALILAIARGSTPLSEFGGALGRGAVALARLPIDALAVCENELGPGTLLALPTIMAFTWHSFGTTNFQIGSYSCRKRMTFSGR
jgi:hypothetical protein